MAFPTRDSLQDMWRQMKEQAKGIKRQCADFNAASLAGPVSASAIENVFLSLGGFRAYMQANAAKPGLAGYVQEQYNDAELNIANEYAALLSAVDSALAWMAANIPQSGGYVLLDQWGAIGTVTRRTFATAALATLRTNLQGVIDALE